MPDTFKFELVSPERLLVSEDAVQVLVPGSEGDFTVLPNHAPVLTTLRPGLLDIVAEAGEERHFFVRGGFAEVDPASLTVLVQQAVDRNDLDPAWLAQQIKNAEEDLADAKDATARDLAEATLARLKLIQATLGLG